MLRNNNKSLGNHVVHSEKKEKERLQWEGFAEKGGKGPLNGCVCVCVDKASL